MSHDRPKCLLPVANIPLILYSLEFLATNNVKEVVIVSSKETKVLKKEIDTLKESHMIGKSRNNFKITYIKLEKPVSMADALREVNDAVELRDEFILISGDIVCNADLAPALKMHYKAKQENKEFQVILTKVFAEIPFSNPVRDSSQELALMVDAETRQILDYGQYGKDQNSYQINRKHITLKKQARQYEILGDLVDTEMMICSKGLFQHLADDFEMKNIKEDFTIHLNSSELTDDQI